MVIILGSTFKTPINSLGIYPIMELIKLNTEKHRSVFFNGTHYIKKWDDVNTSWIINHVALLNVIFPNYVYDYGKNWISYNIIPGILANKFPHTPEFVNLIYNFCLKQIEFTKPLYHGDWALSNIIIDNDISSAISAINTLKSDRKFRKNLGISLRRQIINGWTYHKRSAEVLDFLLKLCKTSDEHEKV